jgi:triacylglycerol lipase
MKNRFWSCFTTVFAAVLFASCLIPATASAAVGYTQTRYPIVLVHGFLGFDKMCPVEYFYGIPAALRSGGAQVYITTVSASNSTEVRGEQLLTQVKQILAATGAAKVNLIGHSHGSPTSRYVASVRPDLVASVTSVGGVNVGSRVADVLVGALPTASRVLIDGVTGLVNFLSGGAGRPTNSSAALASLSTAGTRQFNSRHPQGVPTVACGEGAPVVKGVAYFSWSGGDSYTNMLDPADPLLKVTSLAFGDKNDGMVSSCSSHLGRVIRDDYKMNHLDEVNQTAGIVHLFETSPVTLYRQQANRLQLLGL